MAEEDLLPARPGASRNPGLCKELGLRSHAPQGRALGQGRVDGQNILVRTLT